MTNSRVVVRQGVALLLAVSGGFAAGAVLAAEAANTPVLTEIVVTAQKREQNIQDVPISVIALSAQQLRDGGVTDIKNLQALTPGLTVTSTTSENVTTARIRGIGTVGDNPGLESSVGVVIDGVYRPRNGVGFGNLGEIQQIEILEGPQGELFGKNNDAGVINIVTKRPSTTFGVTAEATGGNYNDREINASVTGPVGAISAARFYAGYQKRDGFMNINDGLGPNSNNKTDDRNMYTMRGQYLITPSDAVSFLVIGDYSKRNESCCGAVVVAEGPFAGIANALAGIPALGGQAGAVAEPNGNNPLPHFSRQGYANQPPSQQIRDLGVSGELDWDIGSAKLTSITAWRDNTVVSGNDVDYTGIDILQQPGNEGNQTDFKQASEEIRLAGKSGPLDWLVGGFFSSEILTSNTAIYAGSAWDLYISGVASASYPPGTPPNFGYIPGFTLQPPGGTFIPGVSGEQDFYHQTAKSYAFFTNETYNIAQGLDLTAGLRYTSEKKTADSNYVDPDGGLACGRLLNSAASLLNPATPNYQFLFGYGCATLFNPFFAGKSTNQSLNESNVSGTVKLSYRFTDDVMAYVSWANGYKAGGFNLARTTSSTGPFGALTPNFDTSFPRETVESYELGLKSTLADRTVRLNASVFDQKYTNFQLNTYTGIQFVVSSVRKVESKGAELDTSWATPLSGLGLSAGVTYAFTNITDFGASLPLFAPNLADPALPRLNNRLSFAPLWSGVASATYTVPISSSLEFRASVSEKYNSSYNTGSDLDPRKLQGAYGLVNARLGLGAPDGKWTVEVWGANLANKYYYQVAFDAPIQYNQIDAFLADPRTFGVTVRTKF
jgi:iron complex outermembrane receptor protein